ncbi:MAG TPA: HD domain-containing phosphohydrolase [Longimicrobiaceae bacterium]|nr:HD domain-containing phosphohydrolase [Longimicrobiaceae bacterium]
MSAVLGRSAPRRERPRVLIVDDDAGVRAVLARVLRDGYELRLATSGEEAEEMFGREGADLVLSDLQMPGIGGLELLQRFKAMDDTVGFIILTGAGTMENAIDALRLQADDYLLKPFNLDEVILAVERALEHRSLLRENRFHQRHLEERVAEQARELEALFVDALLSLANAVEARDDYTGNHVGRVARRAVATGSEMGLAGEELRHLWVGALLHDIGKIAVPDHVLLKPGRLTDEEYEVMKRHPETGAAIMSRSAFLRPALPAVLHHQERWDGAGYPAGLKGEEISIQGRIIAVVDTFDAIVTTRPYRPKRSPEAAMEEIERCSGTQFDPAVVAAFRRALEKGFPEDPTAPTLYPHGMDGE